MKQLTLIVVFVFCRIIAFSQDQGSFNIYEQTDKSYCTSAVIEAKDDCLIISVYDYYGGVGELLKLSREGEIIKRQIVGTGNVFSGIGGIYRDPQQPDLYCAIGHVIHWDQNQSAPFVMHFDEELNIVDYVEVDLPIDCRRFITSRALLTQEGDFVFAATLNAQQGYHRVYMRISADGTLQEFLEDTQGCGAGFFIDVIFEYPEGNRFGDFRNYCVQQGSPFARKGLFGLDEDFVFDTIHKYESIKEYIGDTTHSMNLFSFNATAFPISDSTLLFASKVSETWYTPAGPANDSDFSDILFVTDLDGNISNYLVVGSGNDKDEAPFAFKANDIVTDNATTEKYIYHGCYDNQVFLSSQNQLTITKTDENLNVIWQKSYTCPNRYLQATCLLTAHDGGCIVSGGANDYTQDRFDMFVLKVNPDGTVGIPELFGDDEKMAIAYPNPGKGTLNIRTALQNARVEVYDALGRKAHEQEITGNITPINTENWPSGMYVWKVFSNGKEAECGKWVKE